MLRLTPHRSKDVVQLNVDGTEGQEAGHEHLRHGLPVPGQGWDFPGVLGRPRGGIELHLRHCKHVRHFPSRLEGSKQFLWNHVKVIQDPQMLGAEVLHLKNDCRRRSRSLRSVLVPQGQQDLLARQMHAALSSLHLCPTIYTVSAVGFCGSHAQPIGTTCQTTGQPNVSGSPLKRLKVHDRPWCSCRQCRPGQSVGR